MCPKTCASSNSSRSDRQLGLDSRNEKDYDEHCYLQPAFNLCLDIMSVGSSYPIIGR